MEIDLGQMPETSISSPQDKPRAQAMLLSV